MWEILERGKTPYFDLITNRDVITKVTKGVILPRPSNCPEDLWDLLCSCWQLNPQDRPSFRTITVTLKEIYDQAIDEPSSTTKSTTTEPNPIKGETDHYLRTPNDDIDKDNSEDTN